MPRCAFPNNASRCNDERRSLSRSASTNSLDPGGPIVWLTLAGIAGGPAGIGTAHLVDATAGVLQVGYLGDGARSRLAFHVDLAPRDKPLLPCGPAKHHSDPRLTHQEMHAQRRCNHP